MNALSLRLAILRILKAAEPYAVPQETLHAEANRLVRPAISVDELKQHLSWLLDRGYADFIADPMDPENTDERKWIIKEPGLAVLKK